MAAAARAAEDRLGGVPPAERHLYASELAIGRFGVRVFSPTPMTAPHWHGHVEINLLSGASMVYDIEGAQAVVPPGRLVMFWAGVPHQATEVRPEGPGPARQANIYVPVDEFLYMSHIGPLQGRLLGGAVALLPDNLCGPEVLARWHADFASGDPERLDVLRMELNAVLRRALLGPVDWLREPVADPGGGRVPSSRHLRHVIEMIRFILENLDGRIANADVAAVTGLHPNYAMALFSRTLRMPMKRFLVRMRMLRARALLLEGSEAISAVAAATGFGSLSQFYKHFRTTYGESPDAMRRRHAARQVA